jgi:6-phosphogluconolactonase
MAPAPRPSNFRRPAFLTHACALTAIAALTLLSGCGNFFSCEGKASCPVTCTATITTNCTPATGGTGSSTVDYAYISNSAAANTSIDGYSLGTGALTTITGAPFALGYIPITMVVNPADTFLYAASDPNLSTGEIYGYTVGTGGVLTKLGTGLPLIEENDVALAVSPDSQWLFTLPSAALIVNVYPTNSSTGALSDLESSFDLSAASTGTIAPLSIAVAPSGEYFAAALGPGGANVFAFDTATGGPTAGQSDQLISPGSSQNGVYAVAFDSNNYLYCATTNGLVVFAVTSGVTLGTGQTYTIGTSPRSIAIASTTTDSVTTPNYVYVGNETDGKIYGFSIGTNGVLTAVSGSPFAGPTSVSALSVDSTGKYLIASGNDTSTGIQLFTIGTAGALTSAATAGTGTSVIPGVIATTH